MYAVDDSLNVIGASSVLNNFRTHCYQGDRQHTENLFIPGATIRVLRHALITEYKKAPRKCNFLIFVGLNDVAKNHSLNQIILDLNELKTELLGLNSDNTVAFCTLYIPPIYSQFGSDMHHPKKEARLVIEAVNDHIRDMNHETGYGDTNNAPLFHTWTLKKNRDRPDLKSTTHGTYTPYLLSKDCHKMIDYRQTEKDYLNLHLNDKKREQAGKACVNYFAFKSALISDLEKSKMRRKIPLQSVKLNNVFKDRTDLRKSLDPDFSYLRVTIKNDISSKTISSEDDSYDTAYKGDERRDLMLEEEDTSDHEHQAMELYDPAHPTNDDVYDPAFPSVGSEDESPVYETIETTFTNKKVRYDSNILSVLPDPIQTVNPPKKNSPFYRNLDLSCETPSLNGIRDFNTHQHIEKPPPLMSLKVGPTDALLRHYQRLSYKERPNEFFKGPPLQGWGHKPWQNKPRYYNYPQKKRVKNHICNRKPNLVKKKSDKILKVNNKSKDVKDRKIYYNCKEKENFKLLEQDFDLRLEVDPEDKFSETESITSCC